MWYHALKSMMLCGSSISSSLILAISGRSLYWYTHATWISPCTCGVPIPWCSVADVFAGLPPRIPPIARILLPNLFLARIFLSVSIASGAAIARALPKEPRQAQSNVQRIRIHHSQGSLAVISRRNLYAGNSILVSSVAANLGSNRPTHERTCWCKSSSG